MSESSAKEIFMIKIKKAPIRFESDEDKRAFVGECEKDFEKRLVDTVNEINNVGDIKIIALSGPTCSGKTTAARRIISELGARGKRVNVISIDDFYYDKEFLHKRSAEMGTDTIDYDSADTIDIEALGKFVNKISEGGELICPVFDFHSGRRSSERRMVCGEEDIFIFEGIQAIYHEITSLFDAHGYLSIHIAPHSALDVGGAIFEPNEIRLLRRLVRDSNFRSTSAEFTFKIWDSVRKNEEKNIFPYTDSCLFHIDSTFAYEMGVLKPYLMKILSDMPSDSQYGDMADAILDKISVAEEISTDNLSSNSLYWEFV